MSGTDQAHTHVPDRSRRRIRRRTNIVLLVNFFTRIYVLESS